MDDYDETPLMSSKGLEALGRKVTTTAGHLIGPLADPAAATHYQNAMADLHKQLRRPNLQRSVFSFAKTTPTDLVRSKISTSEIQQRAISYVPDELLRNIPDDDNSYSLFQGFQATLPETFPEKKRHHRKQSRGRKLIDDDRSTGTETPPSLAKLKKDRDGLNRKLEILGIRKNMSSSEIREIDMKISNLATMRKIVLDRLAGFEQEEAFLEHDILDVENRLEDAQELYEETLLLAAQAVESKTPTQSEHGDATEVESSTFMSESIYEKLPAIAAPSPKQKRHKAVKRKSIPILQKHLGKGSLIGEIQAHNDMVTALDFDVPFGTMVTAALDDTVRVWDLSRNRCMGFLEGHTASVRTLQVEDNIVATGSMDATIRLWDLSKARYEPIISEEEEEDDDAALAFEDPVTRPPPKGGMEDCALFTLEAHMDEVTALYFQGDNLISGSADKTLRQWDLEKGRCVQTLDVMWAAAQASATMGSSEGLWRTTGRLPDANADFVGALQVFDTALACGTADGMVRLWDLRSGQVIKSLVGHTGPVTCLQFDDKHLVTGSLDRTIRIWDLKEGSLWGWYDHGSPVTSMMFDSRRIVSAAGENVVKIYDRMDGNEWNCPITAENEKRDTAIVERVRIKDGYMTEGRRDGIVGIWSCAGEYE